MSVPEHEKTVATRNEKQTIEDLERTQTVYDDNFHGLTIKTVLVYLVRSSLHQAPSSDGLTFI